MKYVLITGGATGIGRGFAHAFADLGYNLILSSRNLDSLGQAKKEIEEKYSVQVLIYIADLKEEQARLGLINYVNNYTIECVVNSAGIGEANAFDKSSFEKEKDLIDLNIVGLHHLFKHFYTRFKERGSGRIINVSSLASFVDGPYAATYYATKAYVTSLTKAVATEAKKSGVIVQAFCPGNTKSNFHMTAGTKPKYYKANPLISTRKAVESKRTVIVPGFKNKLIYVLLKFLPYKWGSRRAAKMQLRQKL